MEPYIHTKTKRKKADQSDFVILHIKICFKKNDHEEGQREYNSAWKYTRVDILRTTKCKTCQEKDREMETEGDGERD